MSHLSTSQVELKFATMSYQVSSTASKQRLQQSSKGPSLFGEEQHIERYSQKLSQAMKSLSRSQGLVDFQDFELIKCYLDPSNYPIRQAILVNIGDEEIASNCLLAFINDRQKASVIKRQHKNRLYLNEIILRLLDNQIGIDSLKHTVQNQQITLSSFQNILEIIIKLKGILQQQFLQDFINNLLLPLSKRIYSLLKNYACQQLKNLFILFFYIFTTQQSILEKEQQLNIHFRILENLYQENCLQKAIAYFEYYIYEKYGIKQMQISHQQIIHKIIDKIVQLKRSFCQISMSLPLFRTLIKHIPITKDLMKQALVLFNHEQLNNIIMANQLKLSKQCILALLHSFDKQQALPQTLQTDFLFSVAERFRNKHEINQVNRIILNTYETCIESIHPQSIYFLRKLIDYQIRFESFDWIIAQLQSIFAQCKDKQDYTNGGLRLIQKIRWIFQSIIAKTQKDTVTEKIELKSKLAIKIVLKVLRKFINQTSSSQIIDEICSILNLLLQFEIHDVESNIQNFVKDLCEVSFQSNFSYLVNILQPYKHIKQFILFWLLSNNLSDPLHSFDEYQISLLLGIQQSQTIVNDLFSKRIQFICYLVCLPSCLSLKKIDIMGQFILKIEPFYRKSLLQQLINILWRRCLAETHESTINTLFHNIFSVLSSVYNKINQQQKNSIGIYQKIIMMQIEIRQLRYLQIDFLSLIELIYTQYHIRNVLPKIIVSHYKQMLRIQCSLLEYFLDQIISSKANSDLQQVIKQYSSQLFQSLKCLYFRIIQAQNKTLMPKVIKVFLLILKTALFTKDTLQLHNQINSLNVYRLLKCSQSYIPISIPIKQQIIIQMRYMLRQLLRYWQNNKNNLPQQIQLIILMYFVTLAPNQHELDQIVMSLLQNQCNASKQWIFYIRFIAVDIRLMILPLWKYFTLKFANQEIDQKCRPYLECICFSLANHNIPYSVLQQIAMFLEAKLFRSDYYSFFIILESLKRKIQKEVILFEVDYWSGLVNKLVKQLKQTLYLTKQAKYKTPNIKIIANFGTIIQIISKASKLRSKQLSNDTVSLMKVILSTPTLCYQVRLDKMVGLKNISIFHHNSFVNVAIQFLASSKYFMHLFVALQFKQTTSPICYMLQKALLNLNFSCLDNIGCLELIKTLGCFSTEEQDCLTFIKWLVLGRISTQLTIQQNEAILRLFTFQQQREQKCRCTSYTEGKKKYFQVDSKFIKQHQSFGKKLNICLRCFVLKTQSYCYQQLPKNFFLKQQNLLQIKQSIKLKRTSKYLNESFITYRINLLILIYKGQYCFAKKIQHIWHIMMPNNDVINRESINQLFDSLNSHSLELYCCVYEQQQGMWDCQKILSESSLNSLEEINSLNRTMVLSNVQNKCQNESIYKESIASSFLHTLQVIDTEKDENKQKFCELIDLYSQRYQVPKDLNKMLIKNMDKYMEYLIDNYLRQDSTTLDRLKVTIKRWKDNEQYYIQLYSCLYQKVLQKKRYNVNLLIGTNQLKQDRKDDVIIKLIQYLDKIIKELQNIIFGKNHQHNIQNNSISISIISHTISVHLQPYFRIHLFGILLNNSIITNLINSYNNEQLDFHRLDVGNSLLIIRQSINFLLEQQNKSKDDYQLSPCDYKSVFMGSFIQNLMLKIRSKDSLLVLRSVLNLSMLIQSQQKLRMRILFRIIALFYYQISLHSQDNEVQFGLLQLIIDNLRSNEEVNYLLGYQIGGVYLNSFRLFDLQEIKLGLLGIIQGFDVQKKMKYFHLLLNFLHKNPYSSDNDDFIEYICHQIIKAASLAEQRFGLSSISEYGLQSDNKDRLLDLVSSVISERNINITQKSLNLQKNVIVSQQEVDKLHIIDANLYITFRLVETCIDRAEINEQNGKQNVFKNLIVDIVCEQEASYQYIVELKQKQKSQWRGPKLFYLKSTSNKNLPLQQKKTIILRQQPSNTKSKFTKFDVLIH